jgi:hypothetical protein
MSLLEDLAQAILQNSGDDVFDELVSTPRPSAKDLELSQIFDESTQFGSATICPYVLIFDGWDEISVSASEGFRQRIEETLRAIRRDILANRLNRVRVVLTGRPSLDVEESRFLLSDTPVLTVRPFTANQLKRFANTLLEYRGSLGPVDRSVLQRRLENLLKRSEQSDKIEESQLGILGLPLLALLAIWLSLNDEGATEALGTDRTTLYRRLVDMTCKHGGNVEEVATAPRIVGDKLRELLRRTAAAMTMRGTENISYAELERRLRDSGIPARDGVIHDVMKDNPVANLMISFFFNVGSREHGCEFVHKSIREYLFAECVVETLKSLGEAQEKMPPRVPYWKDFDEGDPRRIAVRRLMPLLAPQWLMPDVAAHIRALLGWEINRTKDIVLGAMASQSETRALDIASWCSVRDLLVDLWDWWAEGVHLRPQPFIRDDTSVLDYKEPFAVWMIKAIAPVDLPRERLPEPIRVSTLDAHVGDALFRLNCTIHFEINRASGWLEPLENKRNRRSIPELLWQDGEQAEVRRYQTRVWRGANSWVTFAPSSPDRKSHYLQGYFGRINAAGWRPEGNFPGGIDMSGVDLAEVKVPNVFLGGTNRVCFQFARLRHATLDQWYLANGSDFSHSFAQGLQFHASAGHGLRFEGADVRGASFNHSVLWRPDFRGTLVKGARFEDSMLEGVNRKELAGAKLKGARFDNIQLRAKMNVSRREVPRALDRPPTKVRAKAVRL